MPYLCVINDTKDIFARFLITYITALTLQNLTKEIFVRDATQEKAIKKSPPPPKKKDNDAYQD